MFYKRIITGLLLGLSICLSPVLGQNLGKTPLFEQVEGRSLSKQQAFYLEQLLKQNTVVDYELIQVNSPVLQQRSALHLDLIDDRKMTIKQDRIQTRKGGRYSWFGNCEAEEGQVNFVVNGNMVTGMIRTKYELYSIKPIGEGLHVLIKEDPTSYPEDHPIEHFERPKKKKDKPEQAQANKKDDDYCVVRLLVAFTDSIDLLFADPRAEIQLATDFMNTTNAQSGVNHQVELARIVQVSYVESYDFDDDLDAFEDDDDGAMDEIHDLRQLYDADLCQLIVSGSDDGCGLASEIGSSYGNAFCVSAYGCISGNLTYTHEFGHLYNCRHDHYVDGSGGDNHGYVNTSARWRTVMAYNDECDDNGFNCTRLMYWSNPDTLNGGAPTGVTDESENADQMNAYYPSIRNFEAVAYNKLINMAQTIRDDEWADFIGLTSLANTASNPFTYLSGSAGSFRAGREIRLVNNFTAINGADFVAYIDDPCNPGSSLIADSEDEKQLDLDKVVLVEESDASIQLFPNPISQEFNLQFFLKEDSPVSIQVYDMLGRQVGTLENNVKLPAGKQQRQYSLENLPPGSYLVRIVLGEEIHIQSLIKQQP